MKTNKLLLLLVAAAVLIGLAKLSSNRRRPAPAAALGQPVLPALDVNAVQSIALRPPAGEPLRIVKGDAGWTIPDSFDYPADFAKIRANLIALKDLKIGQVQRGMSLDTQAVTRVTLAGADGRELAALNLGAARQRDAAPGGYGPPQGRYVARAGDTAVYLVTEALDDLTGDAAAWMDTQLLSIPTDAIQTILLRDPAGAATTLDRSSGTLSLPGLDAATEEFDASRAYGLESALSYLRFEKVADPALSDAQTGLATGHLFQVTLKSGEIYTARIGGTPPSGAERYAKFDVALPPATTNDAARLALEQRVAELVPRLRPWTYLISSYAAEGMTRTRADLVKPVSTNNVSTLNRTPNPEP